MADKTQRNDSTANGRAAALVALAVAGRGTSEPCPDPEQIVAWHDATLSAQAQAQVQAHVARCEHCYALWTGLLRTDQPAAPELAALRWWQWLGIGGGTRRRAGGVLVGALAAGLAVVAVVRIVPFGAEPIPDYQLSIQGQSVTRGEEHRPAGEPVRLRDGNRFSVVLRPETSPGESVSGLALIRDADGLNALPAPPPRALDNGVIVFEGRIGDDVSLPAGESTLVFVGGRAGALPGLSEIRRRLASSANFRTNDWEAWSVVVVRE